MYKIHEICVLERARWHFYAYFRHSVICLWYHMVSDCHVFFLDHGGVEFQRLEKFGRWKWIKLIQSLLDFILCETLSLASSQDGGNLEDNGRLHIYMQIEKSFCNKLKMQICVILIQMRSWMDAFCSITLQGKWWWLSFSFQDWVHYCLYKPMVFKAV